METGNREKLIPPLRPFDYGAIFFALAVTLSSAVLVYGGAGGESRIRIQGEKGRWIFPGDAGELVVVPGPLGDTRVELQGGTVRILTSPCANRTCVAAGKIRAPGQWLVCLPNRVFVSIEGRAPAGEGPGDEELDGLAW